MTCIVGLVHEHAVYIGGDSAGVGGWTITGRADAKVFRNGPFLIAYTTSFRLGQLLRYAFTPPPQPADMDTFRYMVVDFINALRDCLKDGGYAKKEAEQESAGHFLVGYQGRLFHIGADYQVGEMLDGYMAVGAGDDIALGVLYATSAFVPSSPLGPGIDPQVRVELALEAAAHHNMGVRAPFSIEVLSAEPERVRLAPLEVIGTTSEGTNGKRTRVKGSKR